MGFRRDLASYTIHLAAGRRAGGANGFQEDLVLLHKSISPRSRRAGGANEFQEDLVPFTNPSRRGAAVPGREWVSGGPLVLPASIHLAGPRADGKWF
jgi:hypothetical protein